MYKSDS